jgi:HK97 family phage portal protein
MPTKTKSRQRKTVGDFIRKASRADINALSDAVSKTPPAMAGLMEDIIPQMYAAWGSGIGWQPAITWYQLANMYVSWEYTATEKLARTLAGLPAKLYRYEKQGKNIKPYFAKSIMFQYRQKNWHPDAIAHKMEKEHGVKRIEVENHPFLDLVNAPVPGDVRYNFWRMLCIHLELDGSVGVYMAKPDAFGHPTELHILPATWTGQFKPIPANDGVNIIRGYHLLDQDLSTDFTTEEIIWLRYTSLRNPFEGMSALKAQLYAFNLDQYLNQQTIAFYKNGAMFSNMFETDQVLTKTQVAQINGEMSGYKGAKNAGQNFLLHSGLKTTKNLTQTAREAMIDEVQKMARDKMLSAHDMSPTKIGLTEHVNRSNSEVADMSFFNEAIKPRAMLITEFFEPLVHSYDENLDFEFDYPHFQDRAQDIAERTANLTQGVTTRNEERDAMGKEPVDGGDVILVSPMLVPLDSVANPPEPVEPQGEVPGQDETPPSGLTPVEKPGMEMPARKTKIFNTPERKALLWKKYNAEATSYEPLFKRVAIKFFRDTCAQVIDKLEQHGIKIKSNLGSMNINNRQHWLAEHKDRLDEFLPKLVDLRATLKDALKPALMSVLKSAAENQMKELKVLTSKKTKNFIWEDYKKLYDSLEDPFSYGKKGGPGSGRHPEGKETWITEDSQGNKVRQSLARLATDKEKRGGIERRRGFQSIPEREGLEIIYKPYGEKGPGYYYSERIDESNISGPEKSFKADDIEGEEGLEFDLNDPRVIKWIGDRLDDTSKTTAQTTIDEARASLRKDFENGEPLLKMSEHLREYFIGAETWRANNIALTEATAATSQASIEAVVQMDLGDSVGKFLLTEQDEHVRETHKEAGERYSDGYDRDTKEIMGPDDEFEIGEDKMVAPGNGKLAEENCGCRCGIGWEPIK